jgi:hypothetical protein
VDYCLLGAIHSGPTSTKSTSGGIILEISLIVCARIANIAKTRNLSVYAHGVRPINKQSIEEMRKLATDTLQSYVEVKSLADIDMQRKNFEFMELIIRKEKIS